MTIQQVVTKVWIEEGCIVCDVCHAICPEVFELRNNTCVIRPEALKPEVAQAHTQSIIDAAGQCPVSVIRFATMTVGMRGGEAAPAAEDHDVQRRTFVGGAALTIGWAALGGGLGIAGGPALGRFLMPNVVAEPDPRVRVGPVQKYAEMAPGEVNEDHKPQGIWLIRERNRLAALSTICTHLGCIPNWLPNEGKFKCPCHGSGYQPNGVNFEGPAPRPLERFRLYVQDGVVIVDKSKKYRYELGQWDQPGSYVEV